MPKEYDFREAAGKFATGVCVVTTADGSGIYGATCQSFASVSLDPKLVGFYLKTGSFTLDKLVKSQVLCINVLDSAGEGLSRKFASVCEERFDGVEFTIGENGCPVLEGLASFECSVHSTFEAGDHTGVLAKVTKATFTEGEPLLYFESQYRELKRKTPPTRDGVVWAPAADG